MGYRGEETSYFNFKGGMASDRFGMTVENNQAILLRNIYVSGSGGIEKRRGNTEFNASAMVGATTAVTGLGYYKQLDGDAFLMAIAGTKLFKSDSLDGTMDDITGALTIANSANNIFTFTQMNDLVIFVGGAPMAPIKWNGSGDGAALGGSPPSGNFGFTHRNRMFIGNTAADPSLLYWSILGDPEDWSGSGSGQQQIDKNDGDTLVGAATINTDVILLFKQNSIHQMPASSAPFPYFRLFKGTGACGKNAIVTVDGVAYFITPRKRMKATDGSEIFNFPDDIDDIWDTIPDSRIPYIHGVHYQGQGINHLIWMVSSGASQTTNNLAIVWDLTNKCWLQHTTGYKANVACKTQNGALYTGHYNGKIFLQDVDATYTDASETSPGAIDALWRSGWNQTKLMESSFQYTRMNVALVSQTSGTLKVGYGFDFATDQTTQDIPMQVGGSKWNQSKWNMAKWGGQTDLIKTIFLRGRGNVFQRTFSNNVAGENFQIHGHSISGKKSATKAFQLV